jgi:hypothetical protein
MLKQAVHIVTIFNLNGKGKIYVHAMNMYEGVEV